MTTTIRTSGDCRPTPRTSPTASTDHVVLTLWTADPAVAGLADRAGVDRVGVDLERLGKAARQAGLGTWISPHTEADLAGIRDQLTTARLFARINPVHAGSAREIDAVIALGAQVLMLPMVATAAEAARFVDLVGGRATTVLLVERAQAVVAIGDLLRVDGVDEVHVGLNDLALSLGLPNRWLALDGDMITGVGAQVRDAGLRFGVGGIGLAGDRALPIPSDLVYAALARTGATAALLSRSFMQPAVLDRLDDEIARARRGLATWRSRTPEDLQQAHLQLVEHARRADRW
jgi:hypothetical protein